MKLDKCKIFGHKWKPVYIKGDYNGKTVKFIACFCDRCRKGYDDALDINEAANHKKYGTYNEKYYE